MLLRILLLLTTFFFFYEMVYAQGDSLQINEKKPLIITERPDTLFKSDSLVTDTTGQIEKIKVLRRKFEYREQVGTALGMMAFIAIILTTVQTWNPE